MANKKNENNASVENENIEKEIDEAKLKNEASKEAEENIKDEKEEKDENSCKIEKLEAEKAELNDKLLRAMAEFDNFKKRTAREKDEMALFCRAGCIAEILSTLDNFERALNTECKDEEFKKGMSMIFDQLNNAIKNLGATEIEALGQKFDPQLHNAIKQIESEDFGENEVCEVFQKGYKLGDKVIRHAMVVVANP